MELIEKRSDKLGINGSLFLTPLLLIIGYVLYSNVLNKITIIAIIGDRPRLNDTI
jgi:hypothetical protein